ncbi:MAG TPA: hypothetical protein VFS97_01005, partial [Nitrososphaeraceae archaeon]|nr:hypothetical protein [Nitrososphaeraceae archaeon]
ILRRAQHGFFGLVRQKQAIGILGMIFASAGGIAWFLHAAVPALVLWGIAIIIIFKLKRKKKSDDPSV